MAPVKSNRHFAAMRRVIARASAYTLVIGAGVIFMATIGSRTAPTLYAAFHIGLASSVPAKDSHVMRAPAEIRLTFTGPVDVTKAGVELAAGENLVALDSLRAVVDSPRVAVAKIVGPLAGGNYTVKWKAIAKDGAAGDGSFAFMYMPMASKP